MAPVAWPFLSGRRILIAEDEYFLADDMALAVRAVGGEVIGPCDDVADCIGLIDKRSVDAAILDLNLHDQMAYPVARALRLRGIPFSFATGYDAMAIPEEFRDVQRWEKPLDPAMAVRSIWQMVTGRGGQ